MKPQQRVCVISPGLPGSTGGVEASVGRLVRYLDEWGMDWRVVCQGSRDGGAQTERVISVRLGMLQPGAGGLARIATIVSLGWRASWIAARLGADIVHVHGSEYAWALCFALRFQQLRGILGQQRRERPVIVVTSHGSLKEVIKATVGGRPAPVRLLFRAAGEIVGSLESRVFGCAQQVCCVSDSVADVLHQADELSIEIGLDVRLQS